MVQALPDNWLDQAATKGATKWLQKFIRFHLARLQKEQISPEDFADELAQEFESRRLTAEAQQKNYRSNVVQALKVLDAQHPAIALVALSTEQYRVLNDQQKERVAERETRFIDDPQAIVDQAEQLLGSNEWADVGAGLAVVMGRRISEIILSDFDLKSPWSLSFRLIAKKASDQDMTIEIPTLVPAPIVLDAIRKLQNSLSTPKMRRDEQNLRRAKQRVNSAYSHAIAHQCEHHFSRLVPNRSDKNNLYTHIFRAVYATIAAHWYCPPSVPEHQFKAEIQGHYSVTQDGKKLPNYSARSNYDDYAIGDGDGNRDGRLGIKLGHVEGLQVIEAFRHDETEGDAAAITQHKPQAIAVQGNHNVDGILIADLPGSIQAAADHASADWLRYFLSRQLPLLAHDILAPQMFADELADMFQLHRVEDAQQQQTYRQQAINALRDILHYHHPAIKLLENHIDDDGDEEEDSSATNETENEAKTATMKQQTRRPLVYEDDLNRMTRLMAVEGFVEANHAELLHALLDAYEQLKAQQKQGETQTTQEVAQTLNWFTGEIEALRGQVKDLQNERERVHSNQADTAQLDTLQAENKQLKQQLQDTQKRLDAIQKLLGGNIEATTQTAITDHKTTAPKAIAKPRGTNSATQDSTVNNNPTNTRQRNSSGSETKQQVQAIIDAIIRWNHEHDDSHQQLYVSVPIIKCLGALVGATYQPVIRDVLQEQRDALDNMHAKLMLGSRHNVKVDKNSVLKAIAKDFLKLDNWNDVNYG